MQNSSSYDTRRQCTIFFNKSTRTDKRNSIGERDSLEKIHVRSYVKPTLLYPQTKCLEPWKIAHKDIVCAFPYNNYHLWCISTVYARARIFFQLNMKVQTHCDRLIDDRWHHRDTGWTVVSSKISCSFLPLGSNPPALWLCNRFAELVSNGGIVANRQSFPTYSGGYSRLLLLQLLSSNFWSNFQKKSFFSVNLSPRDF